MSKRAWLIILLFTFPLQLFFLSACSSEPRDFSGESPEQGSTYQDGALISVRSDNVLAAGYTKSTRTLTIMFNTGSTYEYYDVDESVWIDFLDAQPHPWSQVGYPILVQGGYAYSKIG